MRMGDRNVIELEQGWTHIRRGIAKLENILEGIPEQPFTLAESSILYTTIYNMCTQKPPYDYSRQLYERYKEAFVEYINSLVLPVLRQKHDEFMLRELVNRWNNHKIMVCRLSFFFNYLDWHFTSRRSLPKLNDVGLICFRDLVYQELKITVRDAVISLIDREREGEQIDCALLKNVLGIFVEIGMGNMDCYDNDFESAMLEHTAAYYSRKAASWIVEDSCPDYMQKAEECLKREKERVSHYLHADSEQKLFWRVEHELLSQYENQLLEKEHSGCHSLLQDGKMDDLSRMYRLFCRIPKGLEPIAHFFKQHVTDKGTTLVKQAEDAASNKKSEKRDIVGPLEQSEKRDIVGPLEQTFVWEVIELHDKYLQYVRMCFVNDSLFHKALKEAFEVFCNKGVAGSTSAELLATLCDNILKKGSSEKLSDEEIEETLEKVVKLLAYIGDKDQYSEFYRKELARRLIFDKSANDEHERSILTKLKQQCGGQFTSKMEGMVLPELRQKHDEFMLRELVNRWNNHKIMVRWLSSFFDYLDCYFTSRRSLPKLNDVGLICFLDLVYQELKITVRDAVISLIDWEREGGKIDCALLKNVLGIFVEIGMGNMDCYDNDFESAMLEHTAAYYSRKAASWIVEDSCPDYMQKAEECLKQEKERVSHYLHADSVQKLLGRVEHELLSQYENQLLEKEHSGCHSLLQDGKMDDLSRMYRLFCRIPKGLEPIAHFFKQHVTDEGTTLVKQAEDAASNKKSEKRDIVGPLEQTFVWEVIELHDKYLQYVSMCFVNDSLFHKALKEAFEVFCNKGVSGSTSAEFLATFCDNILRKGSSEKLSDEDIEETLEKVVKLLAYIGDKDLYSEFYRKKLARRLIFDKSANDEHERSILTKLKQHCGGQFTSKMEGMLTDLTLARENQPKFQKYLDDNAHAHPGIDLTVTVLTTGFWPSYKSFDLNLPAEMVKCVEVFKEFYQTQTKHRMLTWIYSLGTCHLSGNFNARSVELIVTPYQGAALLLFNNAERLSYSEIKSQLNLSDEDIIRLLHSLACLKHKILIKEPNTKSVTQSDYFQFNANFTDKSRKIKIPLPPVDEKKKIIEDVDKDRRYAIDACIVRIMKRRKVLAHAQLVTECVEHLGRMFKPDFKAIKKRIEDLITREYLERDKNNPNMFRYLA